MECWCTAAGSIWDPLAVELWERAGRSVLAARPRLADLQALATGSKPAPLPVAVWGTPLLPAKDRSSFPPGPPPASPSPPVVGASPTHCRRQEAWRISGTEHSAWLIPSPIVVAADAVIRGRCSRDRSQTCENHRGRTYDGTHMLSRHMPAVTAPTRCLNVFAGHRLRAVWRQV